VPVTDQPASINNAQREATIRNRDGLHLRPVGKLSQLAMTFAATITVEVVDAGGTGPTDAKSALGLTLLGAAKGQTLRISAVGADADAAVTAIAELVNDGFGLINEV
jgi:phosphotransferase system HPr (HPr) family protein